MKNKPPKKRSKNLGDVEIKEIIDILDAWSGKLTWQALIDKIEIRTYNRYTRQALFAHERIHHAFDLRKNDMRGGDKNSECTHSPQMQIAANKISKLEAENKRLESENTALLEQFARWAYNAHTRGLDESFLNRQMPAVNRGQTKLKN